MSEVRGAWEGWRDGLKNGKLAERQKKACCRDGRLAEAEDVRLAAGMEGWLKERKCKACRRDEDWLKDRRRLAGSRDGRLPEAEDGRLATGIEYWLQDRRRLAAEIENWLRNNHYLEGGISAKKEGRRFSRIQS